jgi:hypothetical protein
MKMYEPAKGGGGLGNKNTLGDKRYTTTEKEIEKFIVPPTKKV